VISSFARPTGKVLLAAALALGAAGIADAATHAKVIGRGTVLKDGKTSYAQATARAPRAVSAKVTVTPAQKVKISYSLTCSKGAAVTEDAYDPSTEASTGTVSVTAPVTQVLKLPFARPKTCAIVVYSMLSKKAKSTLVILQG